MYLNFEADKQSLNEWNLNFFLLFYNNLDLNNQKILWLPSIFQFERKLGFWTTLQSQDFLLYLVPIKQKFMSTWSGIAYTFMLNVWIVSFGQDIKLVLNIKWFLLFCFSIFLWNSFRKDLEKVVWFHYKTCTMCTVICYFFFWHCRKQIFKIWCQFQHLTTCRNDMIHT